MSVLPLIIFMVGCYLAVGVVFAVAFVTVGVQRVDHAALGSPWSFRLLIFPGAAALWPVLLLRWMRGALPPAPADPRLARVERTRGMLAGAGAYWGVVLLVWFVVVAWSRWESAP